MKDARRNTEVHEENEKFDGEEEILPVVPLPMGGYGPVTGPISAAAGGLSTPVSAGAAPLTGGAMTFGAARDAMVYEDADMMIADKAEEALAADGRITATHVSIAVAEGTVELAGQVSSEAERTAAEETVARVPGVRSVVNNLTIVR